MTKQQNQKGLDTGQEAPNGKAIIEAMETLAQAQRMVPDFPEGTPTVRVLLECHMKGERAHRPGLPSSFVANARVVALPVGPTGGADQESLQQTLATYERALLASTREDLITEENRRAMMDGNPVADAQGWWITHTELEGAPMTRAEIQTIWKKAVQIEGQDLVRIAEMALGKQITIMQGEVLRSGSSPLAIRQIAWFREDKLLGQRKDDRQGLIFIAMRNEGDPGVNVEDPSTFAADDHLHVVAMGAASTGRHNLNISVLDPAGFTTLNERLNAIGTEKGERYFTGLDHLGEGAFYQQAQAILRGDFKGRTGRGGVLEPEPQETAQQNAAQAQESEEDEGETI